MTEFTNAFWRRVSATWSESTDFSTSLEVTDGGVEVTEGGVEVTEEGVEVTDDVSGKTVSGTTGGI